MFAMKAPCGNCPFLKEGAIELRPGRVKGIANGLLANDWESFSCHKTVMGKKTGGTWHADTGAYESSGRESHCYGALIFLHKAGRPSVGMRLGYAFGLLDRNDLERQAGAVLDVDFDDGPDLDEAEAEHAAGDEAVEPTPLPVPANR